jgi:hypothetical protein
MDDEDFLKGFAEWEASLGPEREQYSEDDIAKYDALCSLYLEATPEQRRKLAHLFAPAGTKAGAYRRGYLFIYMRLVSERIKTPQDVHHLRLGLAAAALLEERWDTRDILVSLAFLHRAATQAGIDPAPYFKEIADTARPQTREFIRAFLRRSKRDIKELVDAFSDM